MKPILSLLALSILGLTTAHAQSTPAYDLTVVKKPASPASSKIFSVVLNEKKKTLWVTALSGEVTVATYRWKKNISYLYDDDYIREQKAYATCKPGPSAIAGLNFGDNEWIEICYKDKESGEYKILTLHPVPMPED